MRRALHRPRSAPNGATPGQPSRLPRRLVQLYLGLALYGLSMALLVRSELGVMPWDVLHQGIAERTGRSLGTVTAVVGVLVLLLWVPLRERPGLGTVSNVVVISVVIDAALAVLPPVDGLLPRVLCVAAGIGLNAVATAAYVGVRLGPGPRDGLMTGLVRRTGRSVRVVRTAIEVTVVTLGWLLGGTFGPATVLYAVSIGPLVHPLLPRLTVGSVPTTARDTATVPRTQRRRRRAGAGAGPVPPITP